MKRIFFLFFLISVSFSLSAQIRIEKRRYNKGWYVSLNREHRQPVKKSAAEAPVPGTDENAVHERIVSGTELSAKDTFAPAQPVPQNVKTKPANPVAAVKEKAMPVAKEIQTIASAPLEKQQSVSRRLAEQKEARQSAPPDSDMWEYIFGRPIMILFAIVCVMGAVLLVLQVAALVVTAISMGWEYFFLLLFVGAIWFIYESGCLPM